MKMKLIFAFALTICLFACKEKEEVASITPGWAGTYELSSTKPSYIFQDLLPSYDNFQEKTTATITPRGNTYRLQIQTTGTARKGNSTPVNYGITADMNCEAKGNGTGSCRGKYSNLTPYNTQLDNTNKSIESILLQSGLNLEIRAFIHYQEDAYPIIESTLIKIK